MPIDYSDIFDLQYNPFTQTYDPYWVGWTGHPTGKERAAEDHVVPSDGYLQLYGTPQENIPSTTRCFIGLFELQEVASNITPAYDQFAVWYDELGLGWVRLNPGRSGHTASFWYYDLGTIHQKDTLDSRVPSSGNTSISGVKTFTDTTQSTTKDNGAVVIEGGLGVEKNVRAGGNVYATAFSGYYVTSGGVSSEITLKQYVFEIGDWNMDSTDFIIKDYSAFFDHKKIINIYIVIRIDDDSGFDIYYDFLATATGGSLASIAGTDKLKIVRTTGGAFDSAVFNKTSFNRGWIHILVRE